MIKRYEVALILQESVSLIFGLTIHPKDYENDFLEINFYFAFLVLHFKIYY
jgi:hypothetical protein|tara:strand:+ start:1795 stop:1947 length:153 start_codon:yes stop_codon:yes gene_type:complete